MPPRYRRLSLHPHVQAVMDETNQRDPFDAVRLKAQAVVAHYVETFAESPPFNMQAVASLRGLIWSDDDPRYSADSEIAPEGQRVVLRINRDRPLSRQRFSIGHEIGHTLFPEYELAVHCRKAVERSWADESDLLETLCDVASSELLFPAPWFSNRVNSLLPTANSLSELASEYQASREATVRRLVETIPEPMAAVFFSWKLKPSEVNAAQRNRRQIPMFDDLGLRAPTPMLRVDYAILNAPFERACSNHIPKDKSIPNEGPIYAASVGQSLVDGDCELDLGTTRGEFFAHVLPIFTSGEMLGPTGGCSVVAVLRPQGAGARDSRTLG